MSFGRPPGLTSFTAAPPDRGSFPLDHEGECKDFVTKYMKCMKDNRNNNGACRHLSKDYLACRMQKGLMEKDDMKNLGFQDKDTQSEDLNPITSNPNSKPQPSSSPTSSVPDPNKTRQV